jgi:predicted small lipoprotein YifL
MPSRRMLCLVAFAALVLAGCGRKGPLELPADVQAERAARKAAQDEAAANADRRLSQEGAPPSARQPQPGDIGRRPPPDYPFILDPLL